MVVLLAGVALLLLSRGRPGASRSAAARSGISGWWLLAGLVVCAVLVRFGLSWLAVAGGVLLGVVRAVAPKPINVLIGANSTFTLEDLASLGVRRVSVGGALARAAWGGFMRAAQSLAQGRFDGFGDAASGAQLDGLFAGEA